MKQYFSLCLAFAALLLVNACAEAELASHVAKTVPGQSKSQGNFKVGNPYKVAGKWYRPVESYTHEESGIASWYGPNFHGKPTANGEVFDQNELTAAHRTLQLPSLIRVTNLENGRSLVLRVNDRGPFSRGRVLDVSKRGAELLGFKNQGTARVKIQVLSQESRAIAEAARRGEDTSGIEVAMNERVMSGRMPAPPTGQAPMEPKTGYQTASTTSGAPVQSVEVADLQPPQGVSGHNVGGRFYPDPVVKQVPVQPTTIYVQAGSFTDKGNAERLASKLGVYGKAQVTPATIRGQQFYRVRFPATDVSTADSILSNLVRAGNDKAIIMVE